MRKRVIAVFARGQVRRRQKTEDSKENKGLLRCASCTASASDRPHLIARVRAMRDTTCPDWALLEQAL